MALNPILADYDWKNHPASGAFTFCPRCAASMQAAPVAGKLRPACPQCGFVQFQNPAPAVGILVVDGEKVLLGKRDGAPAAGKWATPSGYIEYDEDFLSTAIREVKEETGLEIDLKAIVHVESAFLSPKFHFLTVYLLAGVTGGALAPGDDLAEVGWFPTSGPLPEMAFQTDIDLIQAYHLGELDYLPLGS